MRLQKENAERKTGKEGDRQRFLDFLRVAATCAVVLLHTMTGATDARDMSGYPVQRTVFLVLMDWVTWCVPVFVMISGYLFLNPDREFTLRDMLCKYCRRIALALFGFGVPFALAELWVTEGGFRGDMLWRSVWMVCTGRSWSHMWYLYLILFLYLLTPLLRGALRLLPDGWAVCALAVLAFGSSILPFGQKAFGWPGSTALPDGGIYLFYYICGYFLAKRKRRLKRSGRALLLGSLAALPVGMAVSRLTGDYSVQMAYNYPFTVLFSLLLMIAAQEGEPCFRKKNTVPVRRMGELCFAVYLVHPVFLNVLYKALDITPFTLFRHMPPAWSFILSLAVLGGAVLLSSFAVAFLLRGIRPLRRYVL